MEFYLSIIQTLASKTAVSIPNGMEFYRSSAEIAASSGEFQFPTGWNSTEDSDKKILLRSKFQFPTGWNSTFTNNLPYAYRIEFQFPTGWNSTCAKAPSVEPHHGFNSQRDGILQYGKDHGRNKKARFQFPTGWNSTNFAHLKKAIFEVSIPNGMEFYPNTHYKGIW